MNTSRNLYVDMPIKTKAWTWSIGIHIILLILFLLIKYSTPVVMPVEELGMEVNLGTSDDGSGYDQPMDMDDPASAVAMRNSSAAAMQETNEKEFLESDEPDAPVVRRNVNTVNDRRNPAPATSRTTNTTRNTNNSSTNTTQQTQRPRYVYDGANGRGGNSATSNQPGTSEGNTTGDEDTIANDFIDNAKASSWGITPEFRYYFGKKPLNGFYVAPYLRIGGNGLSWTYAFREDNGNTRNIDFSGKLNTISGGLLLGAQWHFGSSFLIDWWIIGPSYGSMKMNLEANTDLSTLSADDRKEIEESLDGIGYNGNEFETDINNNGIKVSGKLPMLGIRTGLCIGYCF